MFIFYFINSHLVTIKFTILYLVYYYYFFIFKSKNKLVNETNKYNVGISIKIYLRSFCIVQTAKEQFLLVITCTV